MNISEIKANTNNVSVRGKVVELSEERMVNTRYGQKRVRTATIEDESGKINLSLWENQSDGIEVGSTVEVTGAYVSEWNNNLQLNIGRDGKIEVEG